MICEGDNYDDDCDMTEDDEYDDYDADNDDACFHCRYSGNAYFINPRGEIVFKCPSCELSCN